MSKNKLFALDHFIKFFIVQILFISSVTLNAQGGFIKRHFLPNQYSAVCKDVIEAPNGNLIAVGITSDSTLGSNKLCIVGMDATGTVLWQKIYGDTNLLYYDNDFHIRGPLVYDSLYFYHALCAWNGKNPRTFGILIKFNYSGDTIWQRKYTDVDTLEDIIPQGLTKSVDGGFLMTGLTQWWGANANRKCLVVKTDKNGKELWRKKIGKTTPDVQDGKSIVQDSASKKIVIAGYQYIGNSNNWGSFGNILILDSLGNKILQTTFTNYDAGGFFELIQLKDKNFVVCGGQNANSTVGNLTRYRSLLVKFNINGSKIWTKEYGIISPVNYAFQLHELKNNDLIMTTYLDTVLNHNIYPDFRVKIYRLSPNGNIKKEKIIGSGVNDEQPLSLNPTKDGGFVLAVREVLASAPNPFNIIKIDSTGCDTLPAYCAYEETLDFSSFSNLTGYDLIVFPNPANSFITIIINSSSKEFFTAEISDVSGRIIEEIVLTGDLENQVSLSSYAPGAYTVKILFNDKSVETRKLVIVR